MTTKIAGHGLPCGMLPMLEKTAQFYQVKQAADGEGYDDNRNVSIDPALLAALGGGGLGAAGGAAAGAAGREGFGRAMDAMSPARRSMMAQANEGLRAAKPDYKAIQKLIDAVAAQKQAVRGIGRRVAPYAGGIGGAALGAGAGYGLSQLLSGND